MRSERVEQVRTKDIGEGVYSLDVVISRTESETQDPWVCLCGPTDVKALVFWLYALRHFISIT